MQTGFAVYFSLSGLILILVFLIILSAFFSGSEIGMMSLNRYRLRHLVKQQNKQAIRVNHLLQRPDKLLGIILIGNTFATIFASMIATLIGQRLNGDIGAAIATLILTIIILVFAEMIPKTFAAIHPQAVAFSASRILQLFASLMAPLVQSISWLVTSLLKLFGVSVSKTHREALSSDELRSVVSEAGVLLPGEHQGMLIRLLDLEQATVVDIMVPKNDIVGINIDQPWHEIVDQLTTAQHTRVPVYEGSIDHIIGIIHIRKVLHLVLEERLNHQSLLKEVDEAYFIPETTSLNMQILHFQKVKKRSCFVVNEYGELLGLVTLEDILEEVVGEFTTDIAALSKDIIAQDDKSVIVDASITLRHLKRALGWTLPMIGPRTLSGLIIEKLGYIPVSECCLQIDNIQIEIMKVSDNIIRTVRMTQV